MKKCSSILKLIKKNPKATVEDIYNAAETDPTSEYDKEKLIATLNSIKVLKEHAQLYGAAYMNKIIKEQEEYERQQRL